ncbi:MAG: NAD-dependent epimerase/dehydratase family protein [Sphingobacteriales bacterium]|nr:NAD-dependent epimerase/dehydratase family protein [Sphingobacteriales bacterium]
MILVTGASGMTGARVVFDLARLGYHVRGMVRSRGNISLYEKYCLKEGPPKGVVEWIEGDLLDIHSLEKAIINCDTVFHCAGLVSFQHRDTSLLHKINTKGTENLVNACLIAANIRYFMHVSSVATLSRTPDTRCDEHAHWNPAERHSEYAISKYGAEREVWRAMAEGLNVCIVNPSIILGPGYTNDGSNALIRKARSGFSFYTQGGSGFVDLRDVSDAMIHLWKKGITGERYVLNGFELPYRDLLSSLASRFNQAGPWIRIGAFSAGVFWRVERLRSILTGSKPLITRETAHTALEFLRYDNAKVHGEGFDFRQPEDTFDWVCDYFKDPA